MSDAQPPLPGMTPDLIEALTAALGREPDCRFGWWIFDTCPSPTHRGATGVMVQDRRATIWRCVGCGATGDAYDIARMAAGAEP